MKNLWTKIEVPPCLLRIFCKITFSFLGPKPGHRLPWSQFLREKMAPLTVGHTHRMPYLLIALQIVGSNKPSSFPITSSQPPKYPGRCGPVIYSIQLRFWGGSPRTHPGRTSTLGCQMPTTRPQIIRTNNSFAISPPI